MDELLANRPGPLTPQDATRILELSLRSGSVYTDTLQGGGEWRGIPWNSERAQREGYDRAVALAGFNQFMHVVVNDVTRALGRGPVPESLDMSNLARSRGFIFGAQQNGDIIVTQEDMRRPWLKYQYPGAHGPDPINAPQLTAGADFLQFGSGKDLTSERLDQRFASPIRVYLNPTVNHTPWVVAQLCKDFIQLRGHLPSGKFMDEANAERIADRNDRVVFFTTSPEDLTTILALISRIARLRPQVFEGRSGMLVGERVAVGGRVLPTVKLAQSPHDSEESFSSHHQVLLQRALWDITGKRQVAYSAALVPDFIDAYGRQAASNGWRADRPYMQAQDMRVVDQAIARASTLAATMS